MSANTLISNIVNNILNPIIMLALAVAILYFLWGGFQFVRNADSPEERKKGSLNMIWGVVGLVIMVSAYGILNLILGSIGK